MVKISEAGKYTCIGKEVGESGTFHHQGYIVFAQAKSLAACRKILPRAHWEVRMGTHEQAADYCKKTGDFVETGSFVTKKEQGDKEKMRWEQAWEAAKTGDFQDIPCDIKYRYWGATQAIHRAHQSAPPEIDGELQNIWIYGPPGTGKSRKARDDYPDCYTKSCNKWWDGYQDEEEVLIDDLDKQHECLGHHLKIWADRYPFNAEVKGSSSSIRPKIIIVTSNYHPNQIWNDPILVEAICRRFKLVHMPDTPFTQIPPCPIPQHEYDLTGQFIESY